MAVTSNRNLTLPQSGGDSGVWGTLLNNGVMSYLDNILGATQAITINSSDVNLSITQWNNAVFKLTGTLTGNRSLVLPLNANSATVAVGGYFIVDNSTSGAFTVTVKTIASGSTGVTVAQGTRALLYSDTTNVYNADDSKAQIIPYAGNPNGFVAGTAASLNNPPSVVWDYTNALLYFCTTTGNAAAAIWTLPVSPVLRGFDTAVNLSISATHTGGNLLSIAVKTQTGTDPTVLSPVIVNFQTPSSSNTTGAVATVNVTSALSLSSFATGATLGSANSTAFRFWVAIFNNSGTPVLAIRNFVNAPPTTFSLSGYGVASTTPISGSATSTDVWYTPNGTTLSNCAYRLIGYVEYTSGLTTAGTYTSDPNNTAVFGPGMPTPPFQLVGNQIPASYGFYGPKAWVTFTLSGTTVTVQKSYNVTSVVRTSQGIYTITFTAAMTDAYYVPTFAVQKQSGGNDAIIAAIHQGTTPTTTVLVMGVVDNGGNTADPSIASIAIFGN